MLLKRVAGDHQCWLKDRKVLLVMSGGRARREASGGLDLGQMGSSTSTDDQEETGTGQAGVDRDERAQIYHARSRTQSLSVPHHPGFARPLRSWGVRSLGGNMSKGKKTGKVSCI